MSTESRALIGVVDSINGSGVRLIDINASAFQDGDEIYVKSNSCYYSIQIGHSYTVDNDIYVTARNLSGGQWVREVDVDIAALYSTGGGGGGTVTTDTSLTGTGAALSPLGVRGGQAVADWTIGICRVFAIDGVNGNDANLGYATPATTSASDYAVACAAAGAVAKKTLAGLAAVLPRNGAGRTFEIVIANGGANTAYVYAEALGPLLAGVIGYASNSTVRGTGTNTTAGCVAFDGSLADCTYLGAITATGMNAAGYSPTGTPTTTVIQCTKFGGGAASFATEASTTMPLGAAIRFDAACTTVALRGARRPIIKVAGTDTLTVGSFALPAVPVAGDTFYIEMPGPVLTTCALGGTISSVSGGGFAIAGLNFSGAVSLGIGIFTIGSCWSTSLTANNSITVSPGHSYSHPVRGFQSGLGGYRTSITAVFTGCVVSAGGLHVGTNMTCTGLRSGSNFSTGTVVGGSCTVAATYITTAAPLIGQVAALSTTPMRILGESANGGLTITGGGNFGVSQLQVNASQGACILFVGLNNFVNFAYPNGSITGFGTGAFVGAGVSFHHSLSAQNATQSYAALYTSALGVTGTYADVILFGVQPATWASITGGLTGVTDFAANSIRMIYSRSIPIYLSGTLVGGASSVLTYIANAGNETANNALPYNFPSTGYSIVGYSVKARANTMAGNTIVDLLKDGTTLGNTLTIPAASTARVGIYSSDGFFTLMAGGTSPSTFDVKISNASANVGNSISVVVTIYITAN